MLHVYRGGKSKVKFRTNVFRHMFENILQCYFNIFIWNIPILVLRFSYYISYYLHTRVCGHDVSKCGSAHALLCMWRLETHYGELVLSFHCGICGLNSCNQGCLENTLICWAISLSLKQFSLKRILSQARYSLHLEFMYGGLIRMAAISSYVWELGPRVGETVEKN